MSIDHVSAVLRLGAEVNGTNRLVLLVLAEAANHETDECWPGRKLIAARAGIRQLKYVDKAVAALAEMGLVTVDPNGCPDHRIRADQRPNLYNVRALLEHGGARRAASHRDDAEGRDAPARGGASRHDEGARRAPQTGREPEPQPEAEPGDADAVAADTGAEVSEIRQDIERLCAHLADRIAGHHPDGARPPVTKAWRKDMRLLLDRGPLHDENAQPLTEDKVHRSIDAVFDLLADPGGGRRPFCWADQIRSAGALRDHWVQLSKAFHQLGHRPRSAREARVAANGMTEQIAEALGMSTTVAVGAGTVVDTTARELAAATPELTTGAAS